MIPSNEELFRRKKARIDQVLDEHAVFLLNPGDCPVVAAIRERLRKAAQPSVRETAIGSGCTFKTIGEWLLATEEAPDA